jgi:hypothetical protein
MSPVYLFYRIDFGRPLSVRLVFPLPEGAWKVAGGERSAATENHRSAESHPRYPSRPGGALEIPLSVSIPARTLHKTGASSLEKVRSYVLNQEAHHRVKTYQEEYAEMLQRGHIEYHPDYVW